MSGQYVTRIIVLMVLQCACVAFDRIKRGVETKERPSDPRMHENVRSVH